MTASVKPLPFLTLFLCSLAMVGLPAVAAAKKPVSPCAVSYPSDVGIAWECQELKFGETPEDLFGELWQEVLRFNRIDRRHLYQGATLKVPRQLKDLVEFTPLPQFYPDAADEEKFILVDLTEQFLGAYEYGMLVFSSPIATGEKGHRTPTGEFRVDAHHLRHRSSQYKVEKTDLPYPMHFGLRFYISAGGVAYWIHGRDLPGYPASHGCIGLYDEEMQKNYYGEPSVPLLDDARVLYEWVLDKAPDDGGFTLFPGGPRVLIVGTTPL